MFLTVTLREHGSDLLVREIGALRAAFREARRARPFALEVAVVLPDHMHLVMRLPVGDADYSVRVGHPKAAYARAVPQEGEDVIGRRGKGERGVPQRRFRERTDRDEDDRARRLLFCRLNPVKHGSVERPTDRRWSSVHLDAPDRDGR